MTELLKPDADTATYYSALFDQHGATPSALGWHKGKQPQRFEALCRYIADVPVVVLDYGCGLGHLGGWLEEHKPAVVYGGMDANPVFVEHCERTIPRSLFKHVDDPSNIGGSWDHIVCCGVFSYRGSRTPAEHWKHVQASLEALFARCRNLHVDFLAGDNTTIGLKEYQQDVGQLAEFCSRRLTKRFVIDRSYLPYEFCVHLFNDQDVEPVVNAYRRAV